MLDDWDFGRGDMIDCPKCGFSQPDDRYCASCGVDMAAYKPPAPPLSRRVFSHWMFQVGAVAIAILATSAYLESRRQAAVRAREASLAAAAPARPAQPAQDAAPEAPPEATPAHPNPSPQARVESRAESPAPPAAAVPSDAPAAAAKSAATRGSSEPAAARPDDAAKAADARAASDALGAAAPVAAPKSLRVVMGEFRRAFIDEAVAAANDSRTLNSYGATSNGGVATIADVSARLSKDAAGSTSSATETLSAGQTISILKAIRDAQSKNVGFTVLATPASNDENGLALNVEVVRGMRESAAAGVQDRSFSDSFVIRPGSAAFMAGLVPRRPPDAVDRELYASTPLQILSSASFQSGTTEFAIFFVPVP